MPIDVVVDPADFVRLAPEIDRLATRPEVLGPFNQSGWLVEWWRALGGGRRLRTLVAREGGRVRAVLPLFEETRLGAKVLRLVGSAGGGSDYLDALAEDESARAAVIDAALALGADRLEFEDVVEGSPTIDLLRARAARGHGELRVERRYPCPYIRVGGAFDAYLAKVGRKDNLRRREKWFAQQPGFRIDCATTADAAPAFLEAFFRLHHARWAEDGGTQAFQDGRLVGFHRRVCERYADEGRLRLWTLSVAGDVIACAYAFDDRNRSLYYQSGMAPAWGARSAGLVLFARYVQDAFDRGLAEVDLLRGDEPYKVEWTKERRWTVAARWALTTRGRLTAAGEEGIAAAREAVREALPEPVRVQVASTVRELRRQRTAA